MNVRPFRAAVVVADAGQSLVEFAIVLPFLLLLLAGSIDFGRYMYDGIELGNGARAGAQFGAQNHETAVQTGNMVLAAQADAVAVPNPAGTALFCQCGGGMTASAPCDATAFAYTCPADHVVEYVNVQLAATFYPLFKIPGLPSSLTITRNAIAQVSP